MRRAEFAAWVAKKDRTCINKRPHLSSKGGPMSRPLSARGSGGPRASSRYFMHWNHRRWPGHWPYDDGGTAAVPIGRRSRPDPTCTAIQPDRACSSAERFEYNNTVRDLWATDGARRRLSDRREAKRLRQRRRRIDLSDAGRAVPERRRKAGHTAVINLGAASLRSGHGRRGRLRQVVHSVSEPKRLAPALRGRGRAAF
jgi:hypothetical protein